jgi:hypothetical protein
MRSNIRYSLFAAAAAVLTVFGATQSLAGEPEPAYIPLSQWKLKDEMGAPGSEVRSDGITLKIYSPVEYRGPMIDASGLTMKTECLNPQDTSSGINVRIGYDDTMEESLDLDIPGGARSVDLRVKTTLCAGRRIRIIEIKHGRSGAIFKIVSIAVAPQAGAATIFSCRLGPAKLQDLGTVANGLMLVRGSAPQGQSPFLSDTAGRMVSVVASAVTTNAVKPDFKTDLELVALDEKGMILGKRAAKIGLKVGTVEFDLSGPEAASAVRWEFRSPAPGVHAAVRVIEVGGLGQQAPPARDRAAEMAVAARTLGDKLQALLEQYQKEDRLPPGVAKDLDKILQEARAIDREK